MDEDSLDKIFDLKEVLWKKIHKLVSKEIAKAGLTDDEDELLRLQLTESFRFWKEWA